MTVSLREFLDSTRLLHGKWALTLEDVAWVKDYEAIWKTIEGCLLKKRLEGKPLSNEKYINPKLITWDGEIRARFRGNYPGFIEDIGACYALGVLKIGSVYRQGSNYHFEGV